METYDLHGCNIEEALEIVERAIGKVRMQGHFDMIRVVTGHGVIKRVLVDFLKEYEVDFAPELGNDGALILSIE